MEYYQIIPSFPCSSNYVPGFHLRKNSKLTWEESHTRQQFEDHLLLRINLSAKFELVKNWSHTEPPFKVVLNSFQAESGGKSWNHAVQALSRSAQRSEADGD